MESHARFNNSDDLLKPLRDSLSPLSLSDLKAKAALAPKSTFSLMKVGGAAFFAVLATTAVLWFSSHAKTSSPAAIAVRQTASSASAQATHTSYGTYGSSASELAERGVAVTEQRVQQPAVAGGAVPQSTQPADGAIPSPGQASNEVPATTDAAQHAMPADTMGHGEIPSPENSTSHIMPTRLLALQSRERLYGGIQYGTIMGSINSFGGGITVAASSDWMQASFRYTGTFGSTSSELFFQPVGRTGDQRVSEYALMVGARLEQGDFWASVEAGPNVIHATFNTYLSFPKTDTLSNQIGGSWGASAQATFGYRFNDHLGIDLTGFVSNHSLTYGGILLSVVAGKLN